MIHGSKSQNYTLRLLRLCALITKWQILLLHKFTNKNKNMIAKYRVCLRGQEACTGFSGCRISHCT